MRPLKFVSNVKPRHVAPVALPLDRGIELIGLEAVSSGATIAAIWLCVGHMPYPAGCVSVQMEPEMTVEPVYRAHRIAHEIAVLDVKNRIGIGLLVGCLYH
jgi:hypothetical protein